MGSLLVGLMRAAMVAGGRGVYRASRAKKNAGVAPGVERTARDVRLSGS